MTNWRPFTYVDTGLDTDGVKYIDVPNDREYKVYSINVGYAEDSATTYDASATPLMQIVTSTTSHTSATERILGTFTPVTAMIADTSATWDVIWSPVPSVHQSCTATGAAAFHTTYYNVQIPDIIISTEHRLKFSTTPSTGGTLYMDIEGLMGIRRPSP